MAQILSAYLRDIAARPFLWGVDDCATLVIGWCDMVAGHNGLRAWRGLYGDEATCKAFIGRNAGFVAIADDFLDTHYMLRRPGKLAPGNPVFCTFRNVEAMGLRVDARQVAMRTPHGLLITGRATVLAEWGAC